MESKNQQNWIDRFLRKELTAQEEAEFLKKINEDPNLLNEVKIQEAIAKGIEQKGNENLRGRFQKIQNEVKQAQKPKTKYRKLRIFLSVAAVVGLLIFVGFYLTSPPTTNSLFAKFYEPSEANFGTRSTDTNDLKSEAETAYRSGNYKNAIIALISLTQVEPENMAAKIALGNSYLQIGGMLSAEKVFQEVINSNNDLYIDQANWYLALTYLKVGKIEACKNKLEQLAKKENADFQKEALKLLDKMSDFK